MDIKEKLIELIIDAKRTNPEKCSFTEYLADYLIAHGVTAQEWIPVTERLPVIGRSVIAYNAPAKCAAEAMYEGEGRFLQFRWEARLQDQEVTHWMPLPEPPKGE